MFDDMYDLVVCSVSFHNTNELRYVGLVNNYRHCMRVPPTCYIAVLNFQDTIIICAAYIIICMCYSQDVVVYST